MVTLLALATEVRDSLDETTAGRWTDAQIRKWINEATRDLARETHAIKATIAVTTVAAQSEYTLAATVLTVEMAYYLPGDGRYCALIPRAYENMDAVWGQFQNQQGSEPQLFTTYGYSPTTTLKVFPAPITAGKTINLLCAVTPTELATDGTADATSVSFPAAWYDAIADYAEAKALRKDRDPRWQEARQLYEGKKATLASHGQNRANIEMIADPIMGYQPAWLTSFD